MSFSSKSKLPSNAPVIAVHMQPRERLVSGWVLSSGTVYYIESSYFVINCINGGANLTQASSISVGSNEWFFDSNTKRLYIDIGADPSESFVSVTYRLFFSNRSMDMPYDMDSGVDVNYSGIISKTSKLKEQIDPDDLVGIALAGNANIDFFNDSIWSSIYNKLFWETTEVLIYMGYSDLPANQFQLVYRGYVDSKSYSTKGVKFRLKDFVEKLRAEVPLSLFTEADGDITKIGDSKRRIYGRAKVLGVSLDKIKDGFALTGTFSKTGDTTITGAGSSLLSECSPEDNITYVNVAGEVSSFSIESVDSDTQLTMSETIDDFSGGSTLTLQPSTEGVPYRNRSNFICGHQMREPTTTVTNGNTLRIFTVDDITNFSAGDTIKVDGVSRVILRISGSTITLVTNLNVVPTAGLSVIKQPVYNVWYDSEKLVFERDYTVTNGDPSKITIDELAEFNISKPQPVSSFTFTNGSRTVTASINFKTFFKPWDWVRSNDLTHTTWYQVLQVNEGSIILRTAYAGATRTSAGERKSVNLINDESKILIDCNGITFDGVKTGEFVKTASDVVKHVLTEQGLALNATSFAQAKLDAPYLVSLALPLVGVEDRPQVRDVINIVNQSVLGNLTENSDRELAFRTLSPKKAEITEIFSDQSGDVISYSIESTGKNVAKKITSRYQHSDASIFTGEPETQVIEYNNPFITNISDIEREEILDLYLYNEYDATIMTQRISLLREAVNTIVSLKSNTLFLDRALNELVYLELRDMYERFGTGEDNNFIGVINALSKSEGASDIEVTDLGGFYNKIATYAASDEVNFASSEQIDRVKNGYFTDANGIISSTSDYRINLYG